MSERHPIIAITGSSGAGTSTVTRTFQNIFRREGVSAAIVEGDSYHRFDRKTMKQRMAEAEAAGNMNFSHFGAEANLFEEIESLFREYAATGRGRSRKYLHNAEEAAPYAQEPGTFTEWEPLPDDTAMLFYEGLHGAVVTPEVNVARYPDLLVGVVPVINLEWIQKLWRDKHMRGYTAEAVTDTILRRMHDYVHYICPQFTRTHINFQRVPVVDTSDPFIARTIPTADESLVVIRFDDLSDPAQPQPLAAWINWGEHPEGLDPRDLHSADFLGPLERMVDRELGVPMIRNGTSQLLAGTEAEGLLADSRLFISNMILSLKITKAPPLYDKLSMFFFNSTIAFLLFNKIASAYVVLKASDCEGISTIPLDINLFNESSKTSISPFNFKYAFSTICKPCCARFFLMELITSSKIIKTSLAIKAAVSEF